MNKKWRFILIPFLLLLIVGAVICVYNIYSIVREYRVSEKTYDEARQYIDLSATEPARPDVSYDVKEPEQTEPTQPEVTSPAEETTAPPEEAPQATEEAAVFPAVDFEALKEINSDVVAWIYIEDTNINYPVVQGTDNRHYVSTLIDGRYNGAGSIFMDYRNQPDLTDKHTVIYGHNMNNGSMFADVCNYRNQEYYDAHPTGKIMTPHQNYEFEIVAAYVASLADSAWQLEFFSDEDALQWLHDAMERSGFRTAAVPEAGDRIITLSTCSYEYSDARFVLVGVLKQ